MRALIILIIGAMLTGAVLYASLPAFLADAAPRFGTRIGATSVRAQLNIADQILLEFANEEQRIQPTDVAAEGQLAEQRTRVDAIRTLATDALRRAPLNPRALRQLGQVEMTAGDTARATRLMAAATRQSIRETIAVSWMLERSIDDRNLPAALGYADMALRTQSQMMPVVGPILARIAETRPGLPEVERMLDGNPPWRPRFLALLPGAVTDQRIPLDVLLHLKETTTPPTRADLKAYLETLLARRQFDLAYYTWLQFLPAEQLGSLGLLFNGTFEIPASGLPFDWRMPASVGVSAQIAVRDDQPQQNALRILFSQGRATFGGVSQLTMLAPGAYRLSGQTKGELVGRRGLQWKISCSDGPGTPLGASQMFNGTIKVWTEFEFAFMVPATGCPAQTLQLFLDARSESEKLLSGVAWFDQLAITRRDSDATR